MCADERVRCCNSILILAHLTIWHYDKQLVISKEKQQTKKRIQSM